ncbi:MAG TPA: glutaredoxin family protein [Vicinamibacteria bacterium]|nr:glutaredoxin family protein [Vicinamibacteria bacterium]
MDIKMYTTTRCGDCRLAKRFLDERSIDYQEINLDDHPEAIEIVLKATGGRRQVPTFDINGRFVTASPFNRQELAEALGLHP